MSKECLGRQWAMSHKVHNDGSDLLSNFIHKKAEDQFEPQDVQGDWARAKSRRPLLPL